jgi:hypothetical protein
MGSIAKLKRQAAEHLLQEEDYFLLVIDPHQANVRLPDALLLSAKPIGLHIGYRLALPIPDLTLDEHGISATLSFDHAPFLCHLPWAAVIQMSTEDEHLVWLAAKEAEPDGDANVDQDKLPTRPRLRLVADPPQDETDDHG